MSRGEPSQIIGRIKEVVINRHGISATKSLINTHFKTLLYINAYYLILAYAATEAASFVFWVIAARLYSSTETGLGAAAISAAMLLATFSTLGFPHALVRFLPGSDDRTGTLINASFTVVASVSVLAALAFLVGLAVWAPNLTPLREHPLLAFLFVTFTVAAALRPLVLNVFMAGRRGELALLVGFLDGSIKVIVVAAAATLLVGYLHIFGVFITWGIALVLPVVAGVFFLIPRLHRAYRPVVLIHKKSIAQMFRFSLANYVSELSWFSPGSGLIGWIMVLIVANLLGLEETAYFYVVWLIAAFLYVIPVSISTSMLAEGAHDERTIHGNARRSIILAGLFLVPAILVVFLAGEKFLLIFGRDYSENVTSLLRVLSLASLPLAFNSISLGIWRVQRKLIPIVALGVTIAALSIGLTYGLNPKFGILAPGLAWLVAQTSTAILIGRTAWHGRSTALGLRSPSDSFAPP